MTAAGSAVRPAWLNAGTRTRDYLEARRALDEGRPVHLALGDLPGARFWTWYGGMVRPELSRRTSAAADPSGSTAAAPQFPAPSGRVAVWYSSGAKSTYTLARVEHLRPTVLRYEDYEPFLAPYRGEGFLPLILAAASAGMGFSVAYLGVERNDLVVGAEPSTWRHVERTPAFIDQWNHFHPQHRLRSCCRDLEKEAVVAALLDEGRSFSSCHRRRSGWCRDCHGCLEAYYSAKATGRDIGFRLTRSVFDQVHTGEYRPYVASDFRRNPRNDLQYLVRLQIVHGLTFEPDRDCEGEG